MVGMEILSASSIAEMVGNLLHIICDGRIVLIQKREPHTAETQFFRFCQIYEMSSSKY